MTRNEFIDILQRALTGSLNSSSVNENIRYYQEYIDMQIREGQSEEEVIENLGDPRLLAKTIIEAGKHEGITAGEPEYEDVYEEGAEREADKAFSGKAYRMPGWLIGILVVLVIIVIIGIVTSLLSALLPIIIPIACVVLIVRFVQNRS